MATQSRGPKTKEAQYIIYLDFLDQHPSFLQQTLNSKHNEIVMASEWSDLVKGLNSVVGAPTGTKEMWQSRLQDWRYQLLRKQRERIVEFNATGGGPSQFKKDLKDFEQRAVCIFNPITATGNPEILQEAGIEEAFQIPSEMVIEDYVLNVEDSTSVGPVELVPTGSRRVMGNMEGMPHTPIPSIPSSNAVGKSTNKRRAKDDNGRPAAKRQLVGPSASTTEQRFERFLGTVTELEGKRFESERLQREEDKREREKDREEQRADRLAMLEGFSKFGEAIVTLARTLDKSNN